MLRGVWGEHAKLANNMNYGGPDCAAEAPVYFKWLCTLSLVSSLGQAVTHAHHLLSSICTYPSLLTVCLQAPFYIIQMRYSLELKSQQFTQRYKHLASKGKLGPNIVEQLMGLASLGCIVYNIVAKYHDETMIFMLNPCHFLSVSGKKLLASLLTALIELPFNLNPMV